MNPTHSLLARIALGLALLGAPGCVDDNKEVYFEAEKLWIDERYPEAVTKLMVVSERASDDDLAARALFRLGEIHYLNLEEPDKAIDYFSRAVAQGGDQELHLAAHNYIADIYLNATANYDLAILQYQRIINEYAGKVAEDEYRAKIGQAYFAKGNYAQAEIEYTELLNKFPNTPMKEDILYKIANCKFISGESEDALKLFLTLLKKDPGGRYEYDMRLAVAILYEEMDRLDDALKAYREMKKQWPNKELISRKIESVIKRKEKKVTR
ncbi:MAG: tetratricopeptide repeat protein [Nitrospinae bacterium]|nr:tetratricopeptide repeat protein [Nitrospinota bacterium]